MANYFDQFDAPTGGQNFFDQFDGASSPSVAGDVAKQALLTAPVQFLESLPGAIPSLLNLAGRGVESLADKYAPGLFTKESPEAAKFRQEMTGKPKFMEGVISQYLPKAETVPGQYANTATQFGLSAVTAPGNLLRNVGAGVAGGLASETGGQLTKGTEAEPYVRAGLGIAGTAAGLRAAEANAARAAARAVPEAATIENAAVREYKDLRSGHVQQPMTQPMLDIIADDIKGAVNREGPRASVAGSGHSAIDEIRTPATKGAPDIADLVTARQNFKSYFENPMPDPNKAVAAIAIPRLEAAIEQLSPGTMQRLRAADANYSAAKAAQTLDKKIARAELRAAGEGSGLNLGNKIRQKAADMLLSDKESRGLSPANRAALKAVNRGTFTQNALRLGSNALGGGGGLGATFLAGGAAAAGGHYTGHPELAALPLGGIGLRMLANASIARQAANVGAQIRARAPAAAGIPGPASRMSERELALLSSRLSLPALLGLLEAQPATR